MQGTYRTHHLLSPNLQNKRRNHHNIPRITIRNHQIPLMNPLHIPLKNTRLKHRDIFPRAILCQLTLPAKTVSRPGICLAVIVEMGMMFMFQWDCQVGTDEMDVCLKGLFGTWFRGGDYGAFFAVSVEN